MKTIKALLLLPLLFGCSKDHESPLLSTEPTVYNPVGTWVYSGTALTYNPGNCGFPSNPLATISGTFTIALSGSNITALSGGGVLYSGLWENNVAAMTAIYLVLPGVTETDVVSFGLSSDTEATGMVTWGMNDGTHTCSGTNSLTGTKT